MVVEGKSTKSYIDLKKAIDMTKAENYSYEEISKDWENFEDDIMKFVARCKAFFGKPNTLWNKFLKISKILNKLIWNFKLIQNRCVTFIFNS